MKNELSPGEVAKSFWMVVDDDEGIREFIGALLEMAGAVKVDRFATATAALSAFVASRKYQFILTDFDMPGMNGFEFCRRVRALSPNVKIMLVTGDAAVTEEEVLKMGFCGLVRKPFPASALQQAIAAAQT